MADRAADIRFRDLDAAFRADVLMLDRATLLQPHAGSAHDAGDAHVRFLSSRGGVVPPSLKDTFLGRIMPWAT